MFTHRRGAHETHRLDGWIGQQGVHGLFIPVDDIEHPIRQACLGHQARHVSGTGGITLGRLEHKCISTGDRHRKHPHGHHRREVEGCNPGDHPQRLAHAPGVDTVGHSFAELPLQQLRNTAGKLNHFEPARDRAFRIVHGLAVFGGQKPSELVHVLNQEFSIPIQHLHSTGGRHFGPIGKRFCSIGNRVAHLVGTRQCHLPGHFSGSGIVDVTISPTGS